MRQWMDIEVRDIFNAVDDYQRILSITSVEIFQVGRLFRIYELRYTRCRILGLGIRRADIHICFAFNVEMQAISE